MNTVAVGTSSNSTLFKHKEPQFEEVTSLEFESYLESIKQRLEKEAPEWKLLEIGAPHNGTIYYHLFQNDFSKKTWTVDLMAWVFAYKDKDTYFLFNQSPIQEQETS